MTALQVIDQATVTDPSGSATITLSSIPADFADIMVVFSGRTTISDNLGYGTMKVNGSTTGYTEQVLQGNSSTYAGSSSTGAGINAFVSGGNTTANTFGIFTAYFPKYSSSTNPKRILIDLVTENNATGAFTGLQRFVSVYWNNTAAINSITFTADSGVYVQNSSVTLYGIKENNSLTSPKATGGIVSYDSVNSKWVHAFTASGTFTPSENLTGVEYLVIAGGGGGGRGDNTNNEPGGGGAGGYRSSVSGELSGRGAAAESSISLTASTGYAVVVGAGGSGSSPANGTNSSFFGITSLGGGYGAFTSNVAGGADGGSGGGGAHNTTAGGAGTLGQGHDGGTPTNSSSGAGGGGAGQAGQGGNYITAVPAHGGDGIQSSITGFATYRAGGGAGFVYSVTNEGGLGGGASHSGSTSEAGSNGVPGTGGGGSAGYGNAGSATASGGNGGSGVVIVRYDA
jgi:hypothetical protein